MHLCILPESKLTGCLCEAVARLVQQYKHLTTDIKYARGQILLPDHLNPYPIRQYMIYKNPALLISTSIRNQQR